jgi:hypothetical protein
MADFPKDYNLKELTLTLCTGEIWDIRYIYHELNIFEDIWSPTMSGSVLISDTQNRLANFPIFGFETLTIGLETPGKGLLSKTFRVYSATDRHLGKDRNLAYILNFCADEAWKNYKVRVSKSYKSKQIHEIVADLHNTWLGGGTIEIEPSKYIHHIIIPNLHPIQGIQWLSTRANPSSYNGANYLYYQTFDKFYWIPIEKCLEKGPVQDIIYQPANVRQSGTHHARTINQDLEAIQAYTVDFYSDVRENQEQGMYASELITHSHVRKKWERFTWDYVGNFDKHKHLYPGNKLYSNSRQDLHNKANKFKMYSTGVAPFLNQVDRWLLDRVSQLQQLQNIKLSVSVPGNSNLKVGDVVKFEMPSPEPPQNNQQMVDKHYRGKFLISGIRHKVDQKQYVTVLELVKDSVFEAYP